MYKMTLGLIVASIFTAASANACIGQLSKDERNALNDRIESGFARLLEGGNILFSDTTSTREVIGSKGNCSAVYIERTDVVVYASRNNKSDVCRAVVSTVLSEGQIGQDDILSQNVISTKCEDTKDL